MENRDVPDCCRNCKNYGYEIEDYCSPVSYCELNIYLPYKKQSCKKQEPIIVELTKE